MLMILFFGHSKTFNTHTHTLEFDHCLNDQFLYRNKNAIYGKRKF